MRWKADICPPTRIYLWMFCGAHRFGTLAGAPFVFFCAVHNLLYNGLICLRRVATTKTPPIPKKRKCGRWQHALLLLDFMTSISLDVNVITISAAISACEKGSQWPTALRLLAASMEKNVISYSAAMSACAKGMQWQHAPWSMVCFFVLLAVW